MEAHAKDSKTVWGNDTLPISNGEQVNSQDKKSESDGEHKEDVQEKSAAYADISDMEVLFQYYSLSSWFLLKTNSTVNEIIFC